MADDVQVQETQGGEAQEGGLFDTYLQAVPEEARETVTSYLKDAEKNVNSRLQESAEIKKTWEPFQSVQEALSPYAQNPEVLAERLAWLDQVTADESALDNWVREYAKERGLTLGEAEEAIAEEEAQGELSREQVQKLVEEQAQQLIAPLQEQQQELVTLRMTDVEETNINSWFTQLEAKEKKHFDEDEKMAIMDLGIQEEREDWLDYAYDRWQKLGATWQKNFVEDKAGQPQTPISAGGQEAFKATTDWGEANKQMRERFRAMRQ